MWVVCSNAAWHTTNVRGKPEEVVIILQRNMSEDTKCLSIVMGIFVNRIKTMD